jgi:hypothetical protein
MDAESIEMRLQDLHRERGRLLLHGKSTDKINSAIVALHNEQAALLDLENARTEQSREAAATAQATEIAKLKADVGHYAESSAQCKAKADKLLAEYAEVMRLRYQHAKSQAQATGRLNALAGSNLPAPAIPAMQRQDSLLVVEQLRKISGHPSEYGNIRLPSATKSL